MRELQKHQSNDESLLVYQYNVTKIRIQFVTDSIHKLIMT